MASVMIGLALFLTTGGHLAILQGVAWTQMLRDFARTDSLGAAIGKTLDGQHPCTLCKKITETANGKKDSGLVSAKAKLGEFLPHSHPLLAPPSSQPFQFPAEMLNKPSEICFAPPVPVPISVG